MLDPKHIRVGRQTELDSLHRHRVIEKVPNGLEEPRVQGGWTEDYNNFPRMMRCVLQDFWERTHALRCLTSPWLSDTR